jgi:hypothetical protein
MPAMPDVPVAPCVDVEASISGQPPALCRAAGSFSARDRATALIASVSIRPACASDAVVPRVAVSIAREASWMIAPDTGSTARETI